MKLSALAYLSMYFLNVCALKRCTTQEPLFQLSMNMFFGTFAIPALLFGQCITEISPASPRLLAVTCKFWGFLILK